DEKRHDQHRQIPFIVEKCVDFLLARGLESEGLFISSSFSFVSSSSSHPLHLLPLFLFPFLFPFLFLFLFSSSSFSLLYLLLLLFLILLLLSGMFRIEGRAVDVARLTKQFDEGQGHSIQFSHKRHSGMDENLISHVFKRYLRDVRQPFRTLLC